MREKREQGEAEGTAWLFGIGLEVREERAPLEYRFKAFITLPCLLPIYGDLATFE